MAVAVAAAVAVVVVAAAATAGIQVFAALVTLAAQLAMATDFDAQQHAAALAIVK